LLFADDPAAPDEITQEIGAVTGTRRLVGMLCKRATGTL